MKIKGLLLGSAAALMSVTGARAADAVVIAEPEPVEYVRVCDAYGAGYFYIPGTETCLRVSGYVWFQVGTVGNTSFFDSPSFLTYGYGANQEGWLTNTRSRLELDARSSTEWGTLRGNIRFQADTTFNGDAAVGIDQAIVQLGGFRVGYANTVWNDSIGAGSAAYGSHSYGSMSYGDAQVQQMSYSVGSENGFAATISLEDDALAGDGYVPDIVGAISYNQSWGAVWAKVGYDNSYNDVVGSPWQGDSGWGATVGVHLNVPGYEGSSLRVIGYYSDSDNRFGEISPSGAFFGAFSPNGASNGTAEWSVLTSYYHQFTPTFGASVGFQWFDNYYIGLTDVGSGADGWAAELALVWTPVENLEIRSEIYYDKTPTLEATPSGFLRLTRFF